MKLIVGLGNPGSEYHLTPHNLGFMVVDRLAEVCRAQFSRREARARVAVARFHGEQVILAKPRTFMNLSGVSVSGLLRSLDVTPEDLIVLVDDIDLPLGTLRVRRKGSSGGHNGLKSIIGALETDVFTRIRMGAGPDQPVEDLVNYVLSPFGEGDRKVVDGMIEQALQAIRVILKEGVEKAMNLFNRKVPAQEQ